MFGRRYHLMNKACMSWAVRVDKLPSTTFPTSTKAFRKYSQTGLETSHLRAWCHGKQGRPLRSSSRANDIMRGQRSSDSLLFLFPPHYFADSDTNKMLHKCSLRGMNKKTCLFKVICHLEQVCHLPKRLIATAAQTRCP